MNAIFGLGRFLFAIPIFIFGINNFVNMVRLESWHTGGKVGVILSGIALIAASISFIIKKYDKLAAVSLAFMLILFVAILHIPSYLNSVDSRDQMNAMSGILQDLIIAGSALLYARHVAADPAVIG